MTIEKAMRFARDGKHQEALRLYSEVIEKEPEDNDAYGHRAWLLRQLGDYENAISDYRFILQSNPDDSEAKRQLAWCLHEVGTPDEALSLMREALQENPLDRAALRMCLRWSEGGESLERSEHGSGVAPLNRVIEALEGSMDTETSSSQPDTGRLLYSIVRLFNPATIVETGTFVGYSTLCMAQALADNGNGHLHSFDLFEPLPESYVSPIVSDVRDSLALVRVHLREAGLENRVTLHKGDSKAELARVFPEAEPRIDLAFIDGDHTLRGCLGDWNAIIERVRPGGVVLLHDVTPRKNWWLLGPPYLLNEKCADARNELSTLYLPTPDGAGIGLVQKLAGGKHTKWSPSLGALLKEIALRTLNARERRW